MNKKLFLGMFAAAGMLLATSCSNDELDVVQSGNEAQVTFSLAAEGGIATRAISDGTGADLLYYAIFDADRKLITTINGSTAGLLKKEDAFPNGSKEDNVEVTLAKGQEYTAVFWAQDKDCKAYTVTAETDGLKVDVDYEGDNNDETRDAFFKAETFKVTGNTEIDVVLKRPFAQINVGVTEADWKAAVESGIEITESKVVIKNAATSINLLDGTVSGEEEVTYDFATIPAKFATAETLEVDVNRDGTIQDDEKYKYLSMSYILTDNDAERTTLEADGLQFTFSPENGEDIVFDEGLHAVPVQRNWRTNILGKILTGDIQFNIEIDQRFDDNYNLMYPDKDDNSTAVFNVTNATELQTALNNATDGAVIYFTNDIIGDVTATQKPNVKVSILGQGYSFKGVITVDGKSATYTTAGLTIKDVVFDAQTISADACINLGKSGDNNTRYTCNVTVENCTFDVDNAVGIKSYTGGDKNLTITGCTATANAHSLVQVAGIDGILIENSTIKSVRGMNFNSSTNVTVDNCLVDVQKYAVRFGASSGGSGETEVYTIKNSSLKSVNVDDDAVIVLRGTADNSTLTIENTTIEGTKQIENTATNATVIIDIDGVPTVNSTTGLATVVAKGYTNINLVDGTYDMTKLTAIAGKTLTFVGAGENTIFDYSSQNYNQYVNGGNGTFVFKNMTIQRSTETFAGMAHTASTSYENCTITGTYYVYETTAKFTDCKFNVTGDFYNCWLYGTSSATYEKCEFNCSGKSIYVDGNGEKGIDLITNTCVFNDKGGVDNKAAIETGNTYGKRYSLTINNTTVNGFSTTEAKSPAVEGAELGTNVWGNKNYMTKDKLSVTIDDTKVY